MDAKTRAILLIKYKPMIEGFKNAIAEERKKGASDARLAAILQYTLRRLPPASIPTLDQEAQAVLTAATAFLFAPVLTRS